MMTCEDGERRAQDLFLAAITGAKACLPKDTLRRGGAFVAATTNVAILVETAIDVKKIGDLGKLMLRQLGQILDLCVRRALPAGRTPVLPPGHAQ